MFWTMDNLNEILTFLNRRPRTRRRNPRNTRSSSFEATAAIGGFMLVISRIFHGFIPDFPRVCSLRKKKTFFFGIFFCEWYKNKENKSYSYFFAKVNEKRNFIKGYVTFIIDQLNSCFAIFVQWYSLFTSILV